MRTLAAITLLGVLFGPVANAASFFPELTIGDSFAGTIQIDANTAPCTTVCSGPSNFFAYDSPAGIGQVAMILGSVPITTTITDVFGFTGNDNDFRWIAASGPTSNFNGAKVSGGFFMFLYGASYSTSILPMDLSQYNAPPVTNFFAGPNIQMNFVSPDGSTGAEYAGQLTSLAQIGTSDLFSFTGRIGESDLYNVPSVPEPSTWAMLLIGFMGIGLMGQRRRSAASLRVA